MNTMMNEKGRQTKLLAAIAVLAMVVCAFAMVLPSDDVSGTIGEVTDGSVTVQDQTDLDAVLASIESGSGDYSNVKTIVGETLTISKNVTIPAGITLSNGTTKLTINDGITVTLNGTLAINERANLGGTGTIALSSTSVVTLADTQLLGGNAISFSSDAKATVTFNDGTSGFDLNLTAGTATVKGGYTTVGNGTELTVGANAKVIVDTGATTFTNNGTVTVDGTLVINEKSTFDNAGTASINGGLAVYGTYTGDATLGANAKYAIGENGKAESLTDTTKQVPIYDFEDATGVSNTITGNTEWNTTTYLTADITIAEGVTVTISDKGFLDLCGHSLIVKGTLVINGKGYITDSGATSGAVKIGDKGVIQNEGVIGSGKAVTVQMYDEDSKYTGQGSVELTNVKGVVFGTEKKVDGQNVTYTLTVSGDITYSDRDTASIAFDDNVKIIGETEIGRYVKASGNVTLDSGATLTVTGTYTKDSSDTITMENNSTLVATGDVKAVISAKTGSYKTYNTDGTINTTGAQNESSITLVNVKGVTVKVTSKVYDVPDKSDATKTVNMTEQMLSVSGNASLVDSKTESKEGSVTVTGEVYVLSGQTLSIPTTVSVVDTGKIVTEGTITAVSENEAEPIDNYKGAMYYVSNTEAGTYTYTYTDFTTAFGQIANAEGNTVYLMGGYEFTGEIEVADGQTIHFMDGDAPTNTADSAVKYTIGSDAKVTVLEGGTIDAETGNGVFYEIAGILVVNDGGDCVPNEGSYEVTSTDENDNVTYTSAATAINNAAAGSTVNIIGPATLDEAVTIQNGVTVEIADTGSLTANKGITVAEGGKIVNEGTLSVADEYDIVVAGDIESAEGTINLGEKSEMTVTGTVTGTADNSKVNAAYYNNDGTNVYTTVAKAITAVSAMDVKVPIYAIGTFTETGTVTLVQGMTLNVNGTVTLGTVDVETGAILKVAGKMTGTVTGACGTDGTASVNLSKAGNLNFTVRYNNSNSTSTFVVTAIDDTASTVGTVGVTAGTVTVNGTMSFDGKNTLTVASGATVSVPNGATVKAVSATGAEKTAAVTVDGTMDVVQGTLDVDSLAVIAGTLNVSKSAASAGVQINGTLTVTGTANISAETGEAGIMAVNATGVLIVGEKPSALGAGGAVVGPVTTPSATAGYIKAYAGSDMSGAVIDVPSGSTESQAESTEFYINGSLYMTVYSQNELPIGNSFLSGEDFTLTGYLTQYTGVDIENIESWYTDAEMTEKAPAAAKLGEPKALYFKAISASVDVKVSVGSGISLYIDNIRMTSGEPVELTVGTHTVTATVNPGYEGTVQIMFNGAVVDGSFTITADMASAAYVGDITVTATGDISVAGATGGDGMGLTEILLVILVILIVVMAIMVALRLMRS